MKEQIKPSYYKLTINGVEFDVFDLVRAIQEKRPFSFEEASALKYLVRLKEDTTEKRVNDLQKAIECLSREIEFLCKSNAGNKKEATQMNTYSVILLSNGYGIERRKYNNDKCMVLHGVSNSSELLAWAELYWNELINQDEVLTFDSAELAENYIENILKKYDA